MYYLRQSFGLQAFWKRTHDIVLPASNNPNFTLSPAFNSPPEFAKDAFGKTMKTESISLTLFGGLLES